MDKGRGRKRDKIILKWRKSSQNCVKSLELVGSLSLTIDMLYYVFLAVKEHD